MKTFTVSPSARARLFQDHRDIAVLFERVLESAQVDDRLELARSWTEFEDRLLSHMDGEEQFLLAELGAEHPKEVQALREEHDAIRRLVAERDIETDLHSLRLQSLEELGRLLRAHAAKEDQTIYLWAEQELDSSPLATLLEFLRKRAVSGRSRQRAT